MYDRKYIIMTLVYGETFITKDMGMRKVETLPIKPEKPINLGTFFILDV